MNLVESISGIRGIDQDGIDESLVYNYAFSYCKLFHNEDSVLVVAGDTRLSTKSYKESIIKAFRDFGIKEIIDLDVLPIQVCEYGIISFKAQGGIYITASHNEPEYNGLKILKEDGALLYASQSHKLIDFVHKNNFNIKDNVVSNGKIINKNEEAINSYIKHILDVLGENDLKKIKDSNFKILADPNGGASAVILERLFNELGVNVKVVNSELGKFVRLIEPNEESLAYLSDMMKEDKFEFACGFDCDSDRSELVLAPGSDLEKEMGSVVSGQYVLSLVCDSFLNDKMNQTVVTNDCTSGLLKEVLNKYKINIKEVEVGEMNVVEEMEKQNSIIGGEGSNGGTIIFPIKCRDGIMSVVLILRMLARKEESLASILENYPKYYSERVKLNCEADQVVNLKTKLEEYFTNKNYEIKKTGDITGGLKIVFDEYSYLWFRPSKTEVGAFRIIADSNDKKRATEILEIGVNLFNQYNK